MVNSLELEWENTNLSALSLSQPRPRAAAHPTCRSPCLTCTCRSPRLTWSLRWSPDLPLGESSLVAIGD